MEMKGVPGCPGLGIPFVRMGCFLRSPPGIPLLSPYDRKALTEIKKDEKNKDEKNKDCVRATIELSEVPVHLMASTLAPREARRRLL